MKKIFPFPPLLAATTLLTSWAADCRRDTLGEGDTSLMLGVLVFLMILCAALTLISVVGAIVSTISMSDKE